MTRRFSGLLTAAVVLTGCADEDPTGVGGTLIPGGAVRTIEYVLDADQFLAGDTAFAGLVDPAGVGFLVVARDYGDLLDANALVRFPSPPATVEFSDTSGTTTSDSVAVFTGASVRLHVQPAATVAPGPAELELYGVGEAWDPGSASWTLRADTGDVGQSWQQAGGTRGELLGRATWSPGDTLVNIPVDSATVAAWEAGGTLERSGLLVAVTPGTRLRASTDAQVVFRARPVSRPDTVVTRTLDITAATFIFQPGPESAAALRVGGTPSWRSVLDFQPGLDTLTLPCPDEMPEPCVIRLSEVTLNFAALEFAPVAVPTAFQPEDSLRLEVRPLLKTDLAPISRAPFGVYPGGVAPRIVIPAERFTGSGGSAESIELPITEFIEQLVSAPEDNEEDEGPPLSTLTILSPAETAGLGSLGTFGFGAFASSAAGTAAPRLRIIVSIATQVELQ